MKNMTLDQSRQTYEDWKLSGLSVWDYCSNTGLEEGKFYRKNYIYIEYATDSVLRRRVLEELNKGEAMNGPARAVFFGRQREYIFFKLVIRKFSGRIFIPVKYGSGYK